METILLIASFLGIPIISAIFFAVFLVMFIIALIKIALIKMHKLQSEEASKRLKRYGILLGISSIIMCTSIVTILCIVFAFANAIAYM